jgi:hypothetical protein
MYLRKYLKTKKQPNGLLSVVAGARLELTTFGL